MNQQVFNYKIVFIFFVFGYQMHIYWVFVVVFIWVRINSYGEQWKT